MLAKAFLEEHSLVLNGLPLTEQAFISDFNDTRNHHFVGFNARGLRPEKAWKSHHHTFAFCAELLDRMESHGADCVREADLQSYASIGNGYTVVILISHWKNHAVSSRDFGDSGATASDVLHKLFSNRASDSAQLGKFRSALVKELGPMRKDLSNNLRRLAEQLDRVVERPNFADMWSTTAIEDTPMLCRAANRELLDQLLEGVIFPGNRVELRDGLHSVETIAHHFPNGWAGCVDLTICQSDLLASALKAKDPDTICIQTVSTIQLGPRLALSETVLSLLKGTGQRYCELFRDVLSELYNS